MIKMFIKRGYPIIHEKDVLMMLMCQNPQNKCYLDQCKACPSDEKLKSTMLTVFEKENTKQVIYKQWI